MQLSQLFTLTLISTAAALDAYFLCPYKTSGKCCVRFNPDMGTGNLCGPATQERISIDPGSPSEWVCLNNVDRMPVCCYPPQRTTEAVGTQTKCVAGTSVAAPGAA